MNENKLEVYSNVEFGTVRTLTIDGEPYFVGKDVAQALGYGEGKSLANAIAKHVDDDDKGVTEMMTPGGKQKMTVINESGLYSLILSSKLPTAKKFKRWVTAEVLPTIRKHGSYNADYSSLSPQLQYLITLEQKTKELETAVHNTNKKLDSVCDTIQIKTDNWRKKTHMLINKLATARGMEQRLIYLDIYDELENRAGVNLTRRYDNLIDRLYERGASNSVISRMNYIDVIAEDKKLIEIYTSIVKEWCIRYGAV